MVEYDIIISFLCGVLITYVLCRNRFKYYVEEVNRSLSSFLKGDRPIYSDLEETIQSQTISLLKRLDQRMISKTEENEKECENVKGLIADLSHQIRTPLNNIIIYSELVEKKALSTEQQMTFIKKISEESEKINWISQNFFKSSRLESGAIEFSSSFEYIKETIVKSVAEVYHFSLKKDITIEIIPFQDVRLFHNRKWTREAFVNILENAIKYSGSGSNIQISLEQLETYSIIRIKDQGVGIPPKEKCHIFKRYYRGEAVQEIEGAGLGLYIARMILLKENGNVVVENNNDQGCCFMVILQNCKDYR